MVYDLLIKGGDLFIPKDKKFAKADIGIKNGRILKINPSLVPEEAEEVIDASGMTTTSSGGPGKVLPFRREIK